MTAITDSKPVASPLVVPSVETLGTLSRVLTQWPELGTKKLGFHLGESDSLEREGYWHAAVHEARCFLELLVQNMALVVKGQLPELFETATEANTRFRICRRYLVGAGYIDPDDSRMLVDIFRIAGAKGSHPGVTDEPWCRMARQFVRHAAKYLITRYAAWRGVSFKPTPTA